MFYAMQFMSTPNDYPLGVLTPTFIYLYSCVLFSYILLEHKTC